jgi:hypothetical protein
LFYSPFELYLKNFCMVPAAPPKKQLLAALSEHPSVTTSASGSCATYFKRVTDDKDLEDWRQRLARANEEMKDVGAGDVGSFGAPRGTYEALFGVWLPVIKELLPKV